MKEREPYPFIGWLLSFMLIISGASEASECRVSLSYEKPQTNMALLNHVIKEHEVDSDQMCRIKCYLNHDCVSYNVGPSETPGMIVCQLNNVDRYQYPQDYQEKQGYSYRGTENKCAENPCLANQTCQTGFNTEGYRCLCPEGFTGEKCEKEKWIKANYSGPTVCFGAKGDSFGVFAVPYTGKVKQFKLVYVSGGVAWGGGSDYEGNWGDKYTKDFEIHITDVNNTRIAPPASHPLTDEESLQYRLPGQNYMDQQLFFPEFVPFLPVKKNQMFRIWFGEDLKNYSESDNSGETCSDVYIMYAEYEQ